MKDYTLGEIGVKLSDHIEYSREKAEKTETTLDSILEQQKIANHRTTKLEVKTTNYKEMKDDVREFKYWKKYIIIGGGILWAILVLMLGVFGPRMNRSLETKLELQTIQLERALDIRIRKQIDIAIDNAFENLVLEEVI